jgi:SAM-dependent methyltransferase
MPRLSTKSRGRAGAGIPVVTSALGHREDQFTVLADWVKEVATPADALLDIGAGDGDDEYASLIRPLVARFVGVDPAGRSEQHPALDEWHPMTIEAFADRTRSGEGGNDGNEQPATFDLALAIYVAEHVDDPVAFLSASRSCLKPGGSLFVITPNLRHYFGVTAKAAMALGIDDRLLEALRRRQDRRPGLESGHRRQHEHHHAHGGSAAHFPMSYKMNTVRALRLAAGKAGYKALEVRHLENAAVFETYFPGRLVAIPRAYARLVHRLCLKALFGTLICRLVN